MRRVPLRLAGSPLCMNLENEITIHSDSNESHNTSIACDHREGSYVATFVARAALACYPFH